MNNPNNQRKQHNNHMKSNVNNNPRNSNMLKQKLKELQSQEVQIKEIKTKIKKQNPNNSLRLNNAFKKSQEQYNKTVEKKMNDVLLAANQFTKELELHQSANQFTKDLHQINKQINNQINKKSQFIKSNDKFYNAMLNSIKKQISSKNPKTDKLLADIKIPLYDITGNKMRGNVIITNSNGKFVNNSVYSGGMMIGPQLYFAAREFSEKKRQASEFSEKKRQPKRWFPLLK